MSDLCVVCNERPLRYKRTLECPRCYNRRYCEENRDKVRTYRSEWQRESRSRLRDRSDEMPEFDLTAPIAYSTAHTRVAYWRGRAADMACDCGSRASEWAYRGDSPHEQTGTVTSFKGLEVEVAWSPDPMDYTPLCRSCHVSFDRARAKARR